MDYHHLRFDTIVHNGTVVKRMHRLLVIFDTMKIQEVYSLHIILEQPLQCLLARYIVAKGQSHRGVMYIYKDVYQIDEVRT